MAAIAQAPMFYPRFVVLGKRYHNNGKTEAQSWMARSYDDAMRLATDKAALGFGCVVVDSDQRCQVYEMNLYLLKANSPSIVLPAMSPQEYDKFERRQMEQEMNKAANLQAMNYAEWKEVYPIACEQVGIWPRESGQKPIDALQDYAWLEESLSLASQAASNVVPMSE